MKLSDRQKKTLTGVVVILIVGLSAWVYISRSGGDTDFGEDDITVTNSAGEEVKVKVEIADEEEEYEQGLMDRESLCENCGMLFVYEEDVTYGFWMKDTQILLSIAFISHNGTIIDIQQMEPETTDIHSPGDPYRYALEVNQGFFEDNEISVGDTVTIPDRYR